MGTERLVRPPRDGEDPLDWMYATGQMSAAVYAVVKPRQGGTAVAAAAGQEPDGDPLLTESLRHRKAVKAYREGRSGVNPAGLR